MQIHTRNHFGLLCNSMNLLGNAIEIGVANGDFSFNFLSCWKGKLHCMVDCWSNQPQSEYKDSFNTNDQEQEDRYQRVLRWSAPYGSRAKVMRMFSNQAAATFPEGYFDFVYIDANHKYEAIKEDLALWYPLVRTGGVLAGHDYLDGELPTGSYGVKRAVEEMSKERGLKINVVPEQWPSWWVIKP